MELSNEGIKIAKTCHSKVAWEDFFNKFKAQISNSNNSKSLKEIFKLLKNDKQALNYDPKIFANLISGCLAAWDLELGQEIAKYSSRITAPERSIQAAQLYLEAGLPSQARQTANKSLRLSTLKSKEICQLQLLVCNSYVEEGKINKATKMIEKLQVISNNPEFSKHDRANTFTQLARLEFFLGRYGQAHNLFKIAADLYIDTKEWEAAAKTLFNTAACAQNAGTFSIESAFSFVEKSRRIAEKHELKGPLSHCEAFYGLDAFQHGNFAEANEHFRKSLEFVPSSDKSYRRLHILSMLSLTYLACGRYHLARKFGKQTLQLAELDASNRQQSRYTALEAELLWQDGELTKSQAALEKEAASLYIPGAKTLEQFSTLNRYILQSSILNKKLQLEKFHVSDSLKNQTFTNLDHICSLGEGYITNRSSAKALKLYESALHLAQNTSDKYHEAIAYLGIIQCYLSVRHADQFKIEKLLNKLHICVGKLGESPIKTKLFIAYAGYFYQKGDFRECIRHLSIAYKLKRTSYCDRYVLECWLATISGKACKIRDEFHEKLLARQTRVIFSPKIEISENNQYVISKHYLVDLMKYQALGDLLKYLLTKPRFEAKISEIQKEVWQQSLQTQGWQQKIRNTIMRMRDQFTFTVSPFIIQKETIRLFSSAIEICPEKQNCVGRKSETIRLIKNQEMTTGQIAKRLNISIATTKRTLKALIKEEKIEPYKSGRNIYYQIRSNYDQ